MRRTLQLFLLPTAVAIMMSLGIVLTAAAEEDDIEADTNSIEALVPGWAVLDQLVAIRILPPEAREALVRVGLEQAECAAPGSICRRGANSSEAPTSLIERCREANQDDGTLSPAAACRRVAAATDPVASLVERCRAWLETEPDVHPSAAAICRRIANAASVHASLAERCRAILSEASATLPTERSSGGLPADERPERPTRPAPQTVR